MKQTQVTPGSVLRHLVDEFVERFPKLAKKEAAMGRCKLFSYELALFLRKRGVKAHIYHVQHIKKKAAWPNAHTKWIDTRPQDWTHYVVRVGGLIIDVTSRQLDPDSSHPLIIKYEELQDMWNTVERDRFMNSVAKDLLQHKDQS
jgi:hypothetical protein